MNLQILLTFFTLIFLASCSSSTLTSYDLYSETIKNEGGAKLLASKKFIKTTIPNLTYRKKYVAPGFLYSLHHPSDKKLVGRFRSSFAGILRLPYSVSIDTKNRTFEEVKEIVLKAYSKFFQSGVAKVSFSVAQRTHYVEVRGLVNKPGRYLVSRTEPLDTVISRAGGLKGDITSDYFSVAIQQLNKSYRVILNELYETRSFKKDITWVGGDSIFVKKMDLLSKDSQGVPFVTVLGGVSRPGKVLYQEGASLYYFIEKSGGTISGISYNECYVFRKTPTGLKKINFNFTAPDSIPVIYPDDTIFINTQIQAKEDLWLTRATQVSSLISTIALLILAL